MFSDPDFRFGYRLSLLSAAWQSALSTQVTSEEAPAEGEVVGQEAEGEAVVGQEVVVAVVAGPAAEVVVVAAGLEEAGAMAEAAVSLRSF